MNIICLKKQAVSKSNLNEWLALMFNWVDWICHYNHPISVLLFYCHSGDKTGFYTGNGESQIRSFYSAVRIILLYTVAGLPVV